LHDYFSSALSHLPGFPRHNYDWLLRQKVTAGERRQKEKENTMKLKSLSYWVITAMVAFFIGSGGAAELARLQGNVEGLVRLGYPAYFVTIIGFWKVLGAIAILVPRFPRLKEWAYAGIFFNMTGAAATGLFVGVAAWHVVVDLVLAALTITSWALRPASRRLEGPIL
jgi:DoxX-like family